MYDEVAMNGICNHADDSAAGTKTLEDQLRSNIPNHPALNRLHRRMVAAAGTETLISKYTRMHHRHNRS